MGSSRLMGSCCSSRASEQRMAPTGRRFSSAAAINCQIHCSINSAIEATRGFWSEVGPEDM